MATRRADIVVLGASGYLGSAVMERFKGSKWRVVGVDKRPPPRRGLHRLWTFAEGGEDRFVARVMGLRPKVIFNFMGLSGEKACAEDEKEAGLVNCGLPEALARAMLERRDAAPVLCHASTASCYDFNRLYSVYAWTKLNGERSLERWAPSGKVVCWRLGTVFGFSPAMRWDTVANCMVRSAVVKGEVRANKMVRRPILLMRDLLNTCWGIASDVLRGGSKTIGFEAGPIPLSSFNCSLLALAGEIANDCSFFHSSKGKPFRPKVFKIQDTADKRNYVSPLACPPREVGGLGTIAQLIELLLDEEQV